MSLPALALILTLTLIDPAGDAIGAGQLVPPTSPIYANSALFDLREVELQLHEGAGATLRVQLGSVGPAGAVTDGATGELEGEGPPGGDPGESSELEAEPVPAEAEEAQRQAQLTQFDITKLLSIVDVYIDSGSGGATETLEGPSMLLPAGSGWEHAVRISAEGAFGFSYVAREDGEEPAGEARLMRVPLDVSRNGNVMELTLPWEFDPEERLELFAMTGVHDPFSPDGWRKLSELTSPWAYSGAGQISPVIDLLAPDQEAQATALATGVLPVPTRTVSNKLLTSPWVWLMVGGLLLAVLGLVMRSRVSRHIEKAPEAEEKSATEAEGDEVTADVEDEASEEDGSVVDGSTEPLEEEPATDEPTVEEVPPPSTTEEASEESSESDSVLMAEEGPASLELDAGDAALLVSDEPPVGDEAEQAEAEDVEARDSLKVEVSVTPRQAGFGPPPIAEGVEEGLKSTAERLKDGFGTLADATFLVDEGEHEDELVEGSFWHPRSRSRERGN